MSRHSRTFKLQLSPAGRDLLIDAHCHLIRSTRQLLAWGTTLQVAVANLETVPPDTIKELLGRLPAFGYTGGTRYFLGAPKGLNESAAGIARLLSVDGAVPTLASIYLVALQQSLRADPHDLVTALDRAKLRARQPVLAARDRSEL